MADVFSLIGCALMFSGSCFRLRVSPTEWHQGLSSEYDAGDDTRKMRRRVNANGIGSSDVVVTFNDENHPDVSLSNFRCDLSIHNGGELPIEPDDHALRRRHSTELVSKHCGWLQTWDDEGKIALSVELHVSDDIFNELYDRLKLGFYLPTEVWVTAAASTFATKLGPFAEWNITSKKYLYIMDFDIFYAPVKVLKET